MWVIVTNALWMVVGLAGGASLVVQASLNSGLRHRLDSVSWAGLVSYLGGTMAMIITLVVLRPPLPGLQARTIPTVWWLGGLFGAAYLAITIVLLPRIGAAALVALVVAGQVLFSLLCDRFGWFGLPVHQLDLRKAVGALFLVLGVVLVRS
jgi:transporter family-2 protein